MISLGASKKWAIWSLDIKNTCREADRFGRGVYVRARCEWSPYADRRVRLLRGPAYGLNDAPVAFHRPLRRAPVNSAESLPRVGLRFMASFFAPPLYFVVRKSGATVGAATHIYDVLGCGEPDLPLKGHCFPEKRFGKLEIQGKSFVRVSMEVSLGNDFSASLT